MFPDKCHIVINILVNNNFISVLGITNKKNVVLLLRSGQGFNQISAIICIQNWLNRTAINMIENLKNI